MPPLRGGDAAEAVIGVSCAASGSGGAFSYEQEDAKAAGLHGSARTMPRVQAELQAAQASTRALAAQYGLDSKTVAKWRGVGARLVSLVILVQLNADVLIPPGWPARSTRPGR
jgi:hypothetical protein